MFTDNEKYKEEVDQRKKFNIEDRKRIEELLYEVKHGKNIQDEMRDVSPYLHYPY